VGGVVSEVQALGLNWLYGNFAVDFTLEL
jgi:hypothetical protein